MQRFPFAVASTVIIAGLLSCGPDFSPYWQIDRLRVMAVKADPVVAGPMEPVTLSALVSAPDEETVEYHWSWCPFRLSAQQEYECIVTEEDLQALLDESDQDFDAEGIFDLGDDPQAIFVNPFEPEEVRQFCELLQQQIIEEFGDPELAGFLPAGDCTEGYEISVRLQVSTDDETLLTSKRFMLWGGAEEHNENPVAADLQIRPAEEGDLARLRRHAGWDIPLGSDHDEQWVSVDAEEPLPVIAGIPLHIRTLVDPDSLLVYTPPVPVGGEDDDPPQPREESIVYRHFMSDGSIDFSRHLYAPDKNTLEEASVAEVSFDWSDLDEECQSMTNYGCEVRLWSVIRDSRLGVDWIEGRLLVLE